MFILKYFNSLHFIWPALLSKNKKGKKRKEKKIHGQLLLLRDNTGNYCSGREERRTKLRQNQMATTAIMETDDSRDDMENYRSNSTGPLRLQEPKIKTSMLLKRELKASLLISWKCIIKTRDGDRNPVLSRTRFHFFQNSITFGLIDTTIESRRFFLP